MIHLCDNCHKTIELPIEELTRKKKRNKGGRVFCTRSCTSSFYHPSNATKHLTSLTPGLVARDTPVRGIALQAPSKSEVGDREVGEANLKSFDKENEMAEEEQGLNATQLAQLSEILKGLLPPVASTPIAAPAGMTMPIQTSGKIVFTVGAGATPTPQASNTRTLDDSIPMAACDAQLCPLPIGLLPEQVWYRQEDGTKIAIPRDQQNGCQLLGTSNRYMIIAGPKEGNAGEYFPASDLACFRCRSQNPALVTPTNTQGWYSKGHMTLRNIHNNHTQDCKYHGTPRKSNGEIMDFSINGIAPSEYNVEQYLALKLQLHPLNTGFPSIEGVVTTDVTIPEVAGEEAPF